MQKNIASQNSESGYIVSLVTFFVMIIMLSMAMSMSFLVSERQRSATNVVRSTQAYYAAESGIEDALLKLKKVPSTWSLSYSINVSGVNVDVDIPTTVITSKRVTSQADNNGIIRSVEANCSVVSGGGIAFYYGIEAGPGGLTMSNGSEVSGNVFSGGTIYGSGVIDNNAVVSGNGNSITNVHVKGDAITFGCNSATVDGDLTYVSPGGTNTCTVGGTVNTQTQEISAQPLPIPDSQINEWIDEASETECSSIDVLKLATQSNKDPVYMGPCKISGSLTFANKQTLVMTGTVYVTGNITFSNNDTVKLDSSYNSLGGVLMAGGRINTGTGNIFSGSGQEGSYILLISTSSADTAIVVSNNSAGAAFYTTRGGIAIYNNVSAVEVTGYAIYMKANSKITVSTGVVNIYFGSGPGGKWKVSDWQEY